MTLALPACLCRGRPPTRPQQARYGAPPPGTYAAAGAYGGSYNGAAPTYGYGLVDLPSLNFMDTGARIKLMRHVQARPCQAARSEAKPCTGRPLDCA